MCEKLITLMHIIDIVNIQTGGRHNAVIRKHAKEKR